MIRQVTSQEFNQHDKVISIAIEEMAKGFGRSTEELRERILKAVESGRLELFAGYNPKGTALGISAIQPSAEQRNHISIYMDLKSGLTDVLKIIEIELFEKCLDRVKVHNQSISANGLPGEYWPDWLSLGVQKKLPMGHRVS